MDYENAINVASNLSSALSNFVSDVNIDTLVSGWSGDVSNSIVEHLDKCNSSCEKQLENIANFRSALEYITLYLKSKENVNYNYDILNGLDSNSANYASSYSYYSSIINSEKNLMSSYKAKAQSLLGTISSISSFSTVISATPNEGYKNVLRKLSDDSNNNSNSIGAGSFKSSCSSATSSYCSSSSVSYGNSYGGSYSSSYSSSTSSTSSEARGSREVKSSVLDTSSFNDYSVVSTSIGVNDYLSTIQSRGIFQDSNSDIYGDACLAFAYIHAYSMYSGSTSAGARDALSYTYASNFKQYTSDNKQDVMNVIYEDITAGKPVILHVNGNKNGTSRHYVTVVGFKKDVASAAELKEEDLLIIDSWDGKLEDMDSSTSRFMTRGSEVGHGDSYTGYQVFRIR